MFLNIIFLDLGKPEALSAIPNKRAKLKNCILKNAFLKMGAVFLLRHVRN